MSKLRRIIGGMLALTVAVSACALPVPTITAADTAAEEETAPSEEATPTAEEAPTEESTPPAETAPTEEATEAAEQNGVKTERGFEYIIVGEGDEAYAEITGYTGEGGYISLDPAIGGYPVRSIGAGAFKGQENITSIDSFSRNLESIGEGAFEGCTALEYVTVPISVKSVGADAFKGCTSLTALYFQCKDCTIDPTALNGCTGLTVYVVPASEVEKTFRTDFPDISMDYTNTNDPVVIEADGIEYRIKPVVADGGDPTRINYKPAAYVSGAAEGITEITIPDRISGELGDYEVVGIYEKAFAGQDKLASVTMPDSLVTIEAQAFYGTTALKTIDLPDSLFLIMDGAFACSGLTEITLPENCYVGSDYDPAFPPGTSIGPPVKDDFYGAFEDCKELTSFTGSKVMKLMMSRMFKGCEKLTEVREIEGIEKLGNEVFLDCTSLKEIEFSEAITELGVNSFMFCNSLEKITVRSEVCHVYDAVRRNSSKLTAWCYEGTSTEAAFKVAGIKVCYLEDDRPAAPTEAITATPTDYAAEPGSNPGDANCDGKVTVSDVVAILQYICSHEKYPLTPEGQLNAEVDGYDGITGGDAILVQKMDAGIYTPGKK